MSFLNTLHLWTRFATPSRYVVCGVNRLDISCRSGKKQLIYFRKLLFTNRIVVNRDVKFPRQLDHCLTGVAVENVVCGRKRIKSSFFTAKDMAFWLSITQPFTNRTATLKYCPFTF